MTQADALAALHDGTAHMALLRDTPATDDWHAIPLYRVAAVVVAHKESLLTDQAPPALEDLADETVLPVDLVGGTGEDAGALVAVNIGVATMSQSVARAQSRNDVVARLVTGAPVTAISLVWPIEGPHRSSASSSGSCADGRRTARAEVARASAPADPPGTFLLSSTHRRVENSGNCSACPRPDKEGMHSHALMFQEAVPERLVGQAGPHRFTTIGVSRSICHPLVRRPLSVAHHANHPTWTPQKAIQCLALILILPSFGEARGERVSDGDRPSVPIEVSEMRDRGAHFTDLTCSSSDSSGTTLSTATAMRSASFRVLTKSARRGLQDGRRRRHFDT